jgi:hypothetical protein
MDHLLSVLRVSCSWRHGKMVLEHMARLAVPRMKTLKRSNFSIVSMGCESMMDRVELDLVLCYT